MFPAVQTTLSLHGNFQSTAKRVVICYVGKCVS